MSRFLQSFWVALILMGIAVAVLIATFPMRVAWWMFADVFFLFMMCFCHLMALVVAKFNKRSSRLLDLIALVCGGLFVVAFIVEFFLL